MAALDGAILAEGRPTLGSCRKCVGCAPRRVTDPRRSGQGSKLPQSCPEVARRVGSPKLRPKLGECWPVCVCVCHVEPSSTNIDQCWVRTWQTNGQSLIKLEQAWSTSANPWPRMGQISPTRGRISAPGARVWQLLEIGQHPPNPVRISAPAACVRQLLDSSWATLELAGIARGEQLFGSNPGSVSIPSAPTETKNNTPQIAPHGGNPKHVLGEDIDRRCVR